MLKVIVIPFKEYLKDRFVFDSTMPNTNYFLKYSRMVLLCPARRHAIRSVFQ